MFEEEKEALIKKRGLKKEQLEKHDPQDSKNEPLMDKSEDADYEQLIQQLTNEALKNVKLDVFPDSKDFQLPYHELDRLPYEGTLRLGTYLQKTEDIYSVLFASCMRIDVIKDAHIKKCEEEQHAMNQKEV